MIRGSGSRLSPGPDSDTSSVGDCDGENVLSGCWTGTRIGSDSTADPDDGVSVGTTSEGAVTDATIGKTIPDPDPDAGPGNGTDCGFDDATETGVFVFVLADDKAGSRDGIRDTDNERVMGVLAVIL